MYRDMGISGLVLMALAIHYGKLFPAIDIWILVATAVLGTIPVLWSAFQSLREREWASMDMLASIALIFSLADGEWASAAFITLMLAAARILDKVTESRTEKSLRGLLKLRPEQVKIENDGRIEVLPVEQAAVGDCTVIDIGERIPVDGTILSGEGSVDESSLTGESMPVEKSPGSTVSSSTLLTSGSIRVRVDRVGKETTLERIIALVESARSEKPHAQTIGERFGKLYLIVMFIGSILLLAITRDVSLVLAVVLVVCADDIAIAIPIAYLRAIGSAAAHGIIIKGGRHLEVLGKATVAVFDKTGTLTKGTIIASTIVAEHGSTEADVLEIGALASRRSSHPLSKAILAQADERGVPQSFPDSVDVVPGKGIIAHTSRGTILIGKHQLLDERGVVISDWLRGKADERSHLGESISYVSLDGHVIGFITVADELKANAAASLAELKALGIKKIIMLTGDNERTAKAIADKAGITHVYANLLPEEKVARLKEIREKHGVTIMVGDGINDAAVLSIADVGIAMGALGADGAIESAEIVLMRDDLSAIPQTVRLARIAHTIAIQDFWIWGITNIFGLALVFAGFIGPAGAAAYNFISDFFPLFNSVRARMRYVKES